MIETQVTQRLVRLLNTVPGCRAKKRHGGRFQSGDPDIAGSYRGLAFFIEVKFPGGQLTLLQGHELARWAASGAVALLGVALPNANMLLVQAITQTNWEQLAASKLPKIVNQAGWHNKARLDNPVELLSLIEKLHRDAAE